MEDCSLHGLPRGKRDWKRYVAVAMAVALLVLVAVVVVLVAVVLCQAAMGSAMPGNSSLELARLEKSLVITNQSLAEARGQWDGCRKQLGALEGKVSELEQELAGVPQLQEENRLLKAEVAQQQEQLGDLQSHRDQLQLQNQLLQKQLQDMRSQLSGGSRLPAVSLSLLALLLPGMLLL